MYTHAGIPTNIANWQKVEFRFEDHISLKQAARKRGEDWCFTPSQQLNHSKAASPVNRCFIQSRLPGK